MIRNRYAVIHSFTWFILLVTFFLIDPHTHWYERALIVGVYGMINIAVFYVNYFYIADEFIVRRAFWRCGLWVVALVLAAAAVKFAIASLFSDIILVHRTAPGGTIGPGQYISATIVVSLFVILISTFVRFFINTFHQEALRKTLEHEKLNAELAFLKSQINPHFLFNSLNNIYSLAYQKSDKAPEAILKLSGMMRYMLLESHDHLVSLQEEVTYLENYIELQKLRFNEQTYIQFAMESDREDYRIMPLLLISFLENAFKHGIVTDKDHPVRITIRAMNDQLTFVAENRISKLNKDQTRGIGLVNLRRRLDLGYAGLYTLQTLETGDHYYSELFLFLDREKPVPNV